MAYVFDDIDDIYWAWENLYKSVLDYHAPMKIKKVRKSFGQSKFITSDIRKAIRYRNALKRKYNKSKTKENWEAYRGMRNHIVTMRRKSMTHFFNQLCINRAGKPKEFWNSLRPLMHAKKSLANDFITLMDKNGIIRDQKQVSEVFNDYFTNVVKNLNIQNHTSIQNQSHVKNIPKNWDQEQQFNFMQIDHHAVKSALSRIKPNKAKGHDHIPPRALRESTPSIVEPLTDLLNNIIKGKVVPDSWKRGEIVPFHKKDSQLEKENYRPVIILPGSD